MSKHKAPSVENLITAELIKYGGNRLHTKIHDLSHQDTRYFASIENTNRMGNSFNNINRQTRF